VSWSIESVHEAALTPSQIFRFYIDPSTWGSWGHNTRWARSIGPVVEGAIVEVKAGYGTVYAVRVVRVEPDRLVVCEVRPAGMLVTNTYEVAPSPAGVRIRHAIEVDGKVAGLTRLLQFPRLYRRLLDKEIRRLVALASREVH
jgi:Polyketide cyclase / dehydrase and lipid transport